MATTKQQVISLQDSTYSTLQHILTASKPSKPAPCDTETDTLLTALGVTLAIILSTLLLLLIPLLLLATIRLRYILTRPPPTPTLPPPTQRDAHNNTTEPKRHTPRGHLLILLGSGGHTAEMLSILRNLGREYLDTRLERRTWVVSSGDAFSMGRAREVELEWKDERRKARAVARNGDEKRVGVENGISGGEDVSEGEEGGEVTWDIVTVRRARKVHQSLLTTPISSLGCLWDCIAVLRGTSSELTIQKKPEQQQRKKNTSRMTETYPYPDLILTNGPGTGVILVLASLILLFLGVAPIRVQHPLPTSSWPTTSSGLEEDNTSIQTVHRSPDRSIRHERGAMRSIYIESWARVKTMSLSGKILKFMGVRMLVQWRGLAGGSSLGEGMDNTRIGRGEIDGRKKVEGRSRGSSRSRSRNRAVITWPRKMEYVGAVVT